MVSLIDNLTRLTYIRIYDFRKVYSPMISGFHRSFKIILNISFILLILIASAVPSNSLIMPKIHYILQNLLHIPVFAYLSIFRTPDLWRITN